MRNRMVGLVFVIIVTALGTLWASSGDRNSTTDPQMTGGIDVVRTTATHPGRLNLRFDGDVPVVGNPNTVLRKYESWKERLSESEPVLVFGLRWSKVLSRQRLRGHGQASLDLRNGAVSVEVEGLSTNAALDVWLVEKRLEPKRSAVSAPGGRVNRLGALTHRKGGRATLDARLERDYAKFELDYIVVTPAGKTPHEAGMLFGRPSLFQKLYLAEMAGEAFASGRPAPPILATLPSGTNTRAPISAILTELVDDGEEIFFTETFEGNGRTCGTCHPAGNNFTLDPAFIAMLAPTDPLFVAEDPNSPLFYPNAFDKRFEVPALMRSDGLILENVDGFPSLDPNVLDRFVMRSVPHLLGLKATTHNKEKDLRRCAEDVNIGCEEDSSQVCLDEGLSSAGCPDGFCEASTGVDCVVDISQVCIAAGLSGECDDANNVCEGDLGIECELDVSDDCIDEGLSGECIDGFCQADPSIACELDLSQDCIDGGFSGVCDDGSCEIRCVDDLSQVCVDAGWSGACVGGFCGIECVKDLSQVCLDANYSGMCSDTFCEEDLSMPCGTLHNDCVDAGLSKECEGGFCEEDLSIPCGLSHTDCVDAGLSDVCKNSFCEEDLSIPCSSNEACEQAGVPGRCSNDTPFDRLPALVDGLGWGGDGAPFDESACNSTGDLCGALRDFAMGAVKQHFPKTLNRVPGVDFVFPDADQLDALEAFQFSLGRDDNSALSALEFSDAGVEAGKVLFVTEDGPGFNSCGGCHNQAGASDDGVNFRTGVELRLQDSVVGPITDRPPDGGLGTSPCIDELTDNHSANSHCALIPDVPRCVNSDNNCTPCPNGDECEGADAKCSTDPVPEDWFEDCECPSDDQDCPWKSRKQCVHSAGPNCQGTLVGNPFRPLQGAFGDHTFNVPSIIEAADTPPFFHNNLEATLEQAIEFYGTQDFGASQGFMNFPNDPAKVTQVANFLRVLNSLDNIDSQVDPFLTTALSSLCDPNAVCEPGDDCVCLPGGVCVPNIQTGLMTVALPNIDDTIAVLQQGGLHPSTVARLNRAKLRIAQALASTDTCVREDKLTKACQELDTGRNGCGANCTPEGLVKEGFGTEALDCMSHVSCCSP